MSQTILHVEDDSALAEIVELSFAGFGFRGTTLKAESVAEAEEILEAASRAGGHVDFIITDMHLPDGTGLDLVRYVRSDPTRAQTPILILSGDADPKKVGQAYALGANSYVTKAPRGRRLGEVVKTLYDHWLKDVVLPDTPPVDRARRLFTKAIQLRSRYADFYVRIAEQLGDSCSEVSFWLTRALREANLANLFRFVLGHDGMVNEHALPPALLDELEEVQAATERTLAARERENALQPINTRDDAYRTMLELVSMYASPDKMNLYARGISQLSSVAPAAMAALRDFVANDLDDLAGWLEIHATDSALRGQTKRLREGAARIRALRLAPKHQGSNEPVVVGK